MKCAVGSIDSVDIFFGCLRAWQPAKVHEIVAQNASSQDNAPHFVGIFCSIEGRDVATHAMTQHEDRHTRILLFSQIDDDTQVFSHLPITFHVATLTLRLAVSSRIVAIDVDVLLVEGLYEGIIKRVLVGQSVQNDQHSLRLSTCIVTYHIEFQTVVGLYHSCFLGEICCIHVPLH